MMPTIDCIVEQQGLEERMGRVDVFRCFRVPREARMKSNGGAKKLSFNKTDKQIKFVKSFESCLCRFLKVS
jgi:hypothetical protein